MVKDVNEIDAWHFIREDRTLGYDLTGKRVEPGLKLSVAPGKLRLCGYGLHASERAIDALGYAPGPVVCRVRLSGKILEDKDKLCAQHREVLWVADATPVLHEFGCWAAEQTLYIFEKEYPEDKRPREAIEAKRKWLQGEITDAARYAAEYAAWSAARSAAWSAAKYAVDSAANSAAKYAADSAAKYAAWSAANSAAKYAAWSAANSAAEYAAWSAARSAARSAADSAAESAQNEQLTKMLTALKP